MSHTTRERNDALLLIADGKADLVNVNLLLSLEAFNWITIGRKDNRISSVKLGYSAEDLCRRLLIK